MRIIVLTIMLITMANPCYGGGHCVGRFVNPIVASSSMPDTSTSSNLICLCPRAGIPLPVPGIPVGFWEPVRLVDVTKKPMCLVSLGGISCGAGDDPHKGMQDNDTGTSFYHVHWYIYPVIYWLELLADFICLEEAAVDVAYLTEYDPLWGDDAKSAIINPETLLFQNVAAYQACIADCISCSANALANDMLLWCAGCQGMLYPLTGTTAAHNGGVGTSLLIVAKFMAKMHRQLLLWGYTGYQGLCGKYPMPIIRKSQYRIQMTYPIPEIYSCKRIGQTEVTWQAGKEFPVKGEDFAYLIWRKRDCCLL